MDAMNIEVPLTCGARNAKMHPTKEANQLHFRRKAHIGVGSGSEQPQTLATTAASLSDIT